MTMIEGLRGVAISTTGQEKRLDLLSQSVAAWRRALPLGSVIVVTVDGSEAEAEAVKAVVDTPDGPHVGGNTYRVGQRRWSVEPYHNRLGVAVNKNTGIEALMDAGVEHLFLSDDDTWPLMPQALDKHINLATAPDPVLHSMVCWGRNRLSAEQPSRAYATWSWPRGAMLYAHRSVVETLGGMAEEFGMGGHEHAEWSLRAFAMGLTPAQFVSPASYAEFGPCGQATRASILWHAEDMRRPGESMGSLASRRRALTTIVRGDSDWARIDAVMSRRTQTPEFAPFRADENGRGSATLCMGPPAEPEAEEPGKVAEPDDQRAEEPEETSGE